MEENKNVKQQNQTVDPKGEILPEVTNIESTKTFTLPSKGLVYDPTEKIPASITLRRMTTKEDKLRMRNQSEDRIRKDLLQACIMEDIDAGKLKLMDANYLLFRLRAMSLLNDKYKVSCVCPNCQAEFIHELNLLEVPVEYMSEDKLKEFKITLPISKQQIDFKYPSLDNIIRMSDSLRDYLEQFPNSDINEVIYTSSAVLYIDKKNGEKPMLEELEDWMDGLDILDSRAIRDIINKIDSLYGFVTNIKTQCPNCSRTVTHGLPITGELFNPSN